MSIEAWMQTNGYKEGNDSEYVLLGHSTGGYIAAQYAMQYPEKITRVVLMSPVGLPARPGAWDVDQILEENREKLGTFKKLALQNGAEFWRKHWSPFSVMRTLGYYGARQLAWKYLERAKRPMGPKLLKENLKAEDKLVEVIVQTNCRS